MEHSVKYFFAFCAALALAFFSSVSYAQEEIPSADEEMQPELVIVADNVGFGVEDKIAAAEGAVEVTYGDIRLTCKKASINQETRDFSAQGDVVITIKDQGTWKAPALRGNFDKKTIDFGPFRLESEIWYVGGESGEQSEDGIQQVTQGWMTTCDKEHPHYRIQAKKITYYPEDKTFSAKHTTLRIGNVPVFYLPYLYGSTDNSAGWIIRPGYSGSKGARLRLGRAWRHGEDGSSQLFVDGMTKRGIGIGQMTEYETETRDVITNLYAIHDKDPAETVKGRDRRFESEDDRYRLKLYWREQFNDQLSLRVNADMLSDISMLDDWFRHDWRHWGQPKSFASLSYDGQLIHSAITVRPRLNTFYTVSEKLPEWTLDIPRVNVGDSPLVYSSHSSAGYYSMKWRNSDYDREDYIPASEYIAGLHGDPDDYGAFRADTLHTIQLPLDFGDYFTLTPRASIRATSYSRTSKRKVSEDEIANWIDADNPDSPSNTAAVSEKYDDKGGSQVRIAHELGIEGRSRLMSDWMDYGCSWLDVKQVRHAIEPYFNYTFAGAPTVDRDNLYFFDEVDRLERQNFLRLGMDQRLLASNSQGKSRTILSLENYIDIHHAEGDETGRHWGDFGSRLTLHPRKDLRFWTTILHDIGAGEIQRGEAGVGYGTKNDWQFNLKYVYRNDHLSRSAYSMGSTLADFTGESSYLKRRFESADTISGSVNIPLNSKTGLEIGAEYDFEENELEEHHYYLTRDLHCWTLMTGCGWDDDEFEVVVLLRLVAFPNVKLDLNF